ncbi:hypothetical protein AB0B51_35640, partial [Streptomyces griseus]
MGRMTATPARRVLLAAPRGYCAGVDRAVIAVEKALEQYGAPIYVRHEIVHGQHRPPVGGVRLAAAGLTGAAPGP